MAKRTPGNLLGLLAAGLFALVSFVFAYQGDMPWWAGAFWTVCFLAFLLPPGWQAFVDDLEVTDSGVRRRFGPRLREKKEESVRWDDLINVEIVTTDKGPFAEDLFFVLHGREGKGVAVSNSLAVKHDLLRNLQERLSGLDNRAVIEASGCTEVRRFLVWQKIPPGGGND